MHDIQCKRLGFSYQYDLLSNIVDAQILAIRKASEFYEESKKSGFQDYIEIVAEEQGDIVEGLIGCSFVVCQVYITHVVSRVQSLQNTAKNDSKELKTTPDSKQEIRRSFSPKVSSTNIGYVEAINALANYFKHNEEWGEWAKQTGQEKQTISIIQPLGLSYGSSRNLSKGLQTLGGDLQALFHILKKWQSDLSAAYIAELRTLNLVS